VDATERTAPAQKTWRNIDMSSSTATPWRGAGIVVLATGGLIAAARRTSSRQPDSSPNTTGREGMANPQQTTGGRNEDQADKQILEKKKT